MKDIFNLDNKVALVTGGLGILGKIFCETLSQYGAHVICVDVEQEASCTFAQQLCNQYKTDAIGIGCDISDIEQVKALSHVLEQKYGRLDILLNNAATKSTHLEKFFNPTEEYTLETWQEVMRVNVDGMFLMAQSMLEHLKRSGNASIIQTSSIYGMLAPDNRIYEGSEYMGLQINSPVVYGVSKAGVIGLTKQLAALWAPHNIRVNALVPGGVQSGQNETFVKKYAQRVPMGRMATKEDMVGAVIFLASEASRYMTGQSLVIDGGLSIW